MIAKGNHEHLLHFKTHQAKDCVSVTDFSTGNLLSDVEVSSEAIVWLPLWQGKASRPPVVRKHSQNLITDVTI